MESPLDVSLDEASFGPIHGRGPDSNGGGNLTIWHTRVCSQKHLSPFDFSRQLAAATYHFFELLALCVGQLHDIPNMHNCPLSIRGQTDHALPLMSIQDDSQPLFTDLQGQYLAFIYAYTKIHRRPPAEADMQRYFEVTPPSVHRMVLELERKGLISRKPGQPRSIKLLLAPERLPVLS